MKILRTLTIPICIGSWIFAFLTGNEILTKTNGDWIEAPALVIETSTPKRIRSGQTKGISYGTCIRFSYQAEGKQRKGRECGIFSYFDTKQEAVEALESYLEENKENLVARYSISNPDDSYLIVPQKMKRTQYGFAASLCSAIVFSLLTFNLFRKKGVNQAG